MDIQEVLALAIVTLAAIYWLRGLVRLALGSKRGCGSGCGKCSAVKPEAAGRRIGLPQV